MRGRKCGFFTFVWFLAFCFPADSQDVLENWFKPPADKSGLVILVKGDREGSILSVTDELDKTLGEVKAGKSPIAMQLRIAPGSYKVYLPGFKKSSLENVNIYVAAGKLSFLEIAPFLADVGPGGSQITIWPIAHDPETLGLLLNKFKEAGYVGVLPPIDAAPNANTIFVNTDPPWPIRPKPKPPEPVPN